MNVELMTVKIVLFPGPAYCYFNEQLPHHGNSRVQTCSIVLCDFICNGGHLS